MSDDRCKAYDFATLSTLFNDLNGYYDLSNELLAQTIEKWNFLEEKNRIEPQTVVNYMRWSFTASFLLLLNAWQWFLGGILLGRQVWMPAQEMQLSYYSTFFSYGSFLVAQFKGHYTLKVDILKNRDIRKTRKEVWVGENNDGELCICVKDKGRGGEHETRANWFYEVFRDWDLKEDHPDVLSFENDRNFHVSSRNTYTYSLSEIGEEFYYGDPDNCPTPPSNEILLSLWRREDWVDFYPEVFWALEHLKVSLNLHVKLLQNYDKESPYTNAQIILIRSFYNHHRKTGLASFIKEAMEPIFAHVGIS